VSFRPALAVACPFCYALPNMPCVRLNGIERSSVHQSRASLFRSKPPQLQPEVMRRRKLTIYGSAEGGGCVDVAQVAMHAGYVVIEEKYLDKLEAELQALRNMFALLERIGDEGC